MPISLVQAALGAEIEVPTLEGKVDLRIPEGTQPGKVMRLRGKGLPEPAQRGARRPVRAHLRRGADASSPTSSAKLLERFAELSGEEVSPVTKGFLDKLRDLFD